MFLINDAVYWGVSDLTDAAECEFRVLKRLDYLKNRASEPKRSADALMDQIRDLGQAHEARVLADYESEGTVLPIPRPAFPYTLDGLQRAHQRTLDAMAKGPDVIAQPALFDGEFLGFADFLENTPKGWLVTDAKVARSTKTSALLQLGAYAHVADASGVPLTPTVALHLGDGRREEYRLADVTPVFEDRRGRLRELLKYHDGLVGPATWGDPFIAACGACDECADAIKANNDLFLVAGMRADQRRKLRASGVETVEQLAASKDRPQDMAEGTFQNLQLQAELQWKQSQTGADQVLYRVIPSAGDTFSRLPKPSAGDLFFDFEGDPLFEGDTSDHVGPDHLGLEYLWGILHANGNFEYHWADNEKEEKAALVAFMDLVARQREEHPDMHVYHYAAYEVTALKRLTARYQTHEAELDDFLRHHVFVDLYATVLGAIRTGQDSYSIKALEPLYMGEEGRSSEEDAVADGAASVVAYHQYRDLLGLSPKTAAKFKQRIVDYNRYDCVSTLKLRDWLLERADEAGLQVGLSPQDETAEGNAPSSTTPNQEEHAAVRDALLSRATFEADTDESQAYAMLAAGLGYFRREDLQFWWEHFARLASPVEEWSDTKDVFTVLRCNLVHDWEHPGGRARNHRRKMILHGTWSPGSQRSTSVVAAYENPEPTGDPYLSRSSVTVDYLPQDEGVVVLTESASPGHVWEECPVALTPGPPPRTAGLVKAIQETAEQTLAAGGLPSYPEVDVLARKKPRIKGGLPAGGDPIENLVAALAGGEGSYVAVQGPPGTGKTYTGARVIKRLVDDYGWKVGVVAQSHAVVENMLRGIIEAGLSPSLVGKKGRQGDEGASVTWTPLHYNAIAGFLLGNQGGCVLGGTMWDFANEKRVGRRSLDLLVIDEAGQFSIAGTLAAAVSAKRLLLLGDPQQLPQVSQGTHPEPVDQSTLEWVMGGAPTIPRDYGYFLGETYRLAPDLCVRVSALSYRDELFPSDVASQRYLSSAPPGIEVISVPHVGNRADSVEEAEAIVARVKTLIGSQWRDSLGATHRPLKAEDFLVVAPYNAQVEMIRRKLEAAQLSGVRVGTVDKFQGQEAPVSFLSMTVSSHLDVPRGMDFILNRNRINVAVSRAQWLAVIVRSTNLTNFMPGSVSTFLDLGGFLGLRNEA